jgi:3alpha(or 20beta)-hydroxysteroid dehydrogenase
VRGLADKICIVTGAARGMGASAARRLLEEGATVVLTDVLEAEGKALADELGDRARFHKHDVSDEDGWVEVVAFAEREFGRVDVLINNAGILAFSLIADLSLENFQQLIDVNQIGVFLGMKHTGPALERAGGGSIINVSSVEGMGGGAFLMGYTATKFAVRGMTKAAAWELGDKGIRVNSIHPGAIKTPMVMSQGGMDDDGTAERWIGKKTALKRMGEPEEVAALMCFLASDDASYMTGAEIAVDGGVAASSGFNA